MSDSLVEGVLFYSGINYMPTDNNRLQIVWCRIGDDMRLSFEALWFRWIYRKWFDSFGICIDRFREKRNWGIQWSEFISKRRFELIFLASFPPVFQELLITRSSERYWDPWETSRRMKMSKIWSARYVFNFRSEKSSLRSCLLFFCWRLPILRKHFVLSRRRVSQKNLSLSLEYFCWRNGSLCSERKQKTK